MDNIQAPANPASSHFINFFPYVIGREGFTLAGSARSSVPGGSSSWATCDSPLSPTIPDRLALESSSLSWTNSSSDKKCLGWLVCTCSLNLQREKKMSVHSSFTQWRYNFQNDLHHDYLFLYQSMKSTFSWAVQDGRLSKTNQADHGQR